MIEKAFEFRPQICFSQTLHWFALLTTFQTIKIKEPVGMGPIACWCELDIAIMYQIIFLKSHEFGTERYELGLDTKLSITFPSRSTEETISLNFSKHRRGFPIIPPEKDFDERGIIALLAKTSSGRTVLIAKAQEAS